MMKAQMLELADALDGCVTRSGGIDLRDPDLLRRAAATIRLAAQADAAAHQISPGFIGSLPSGESDPAVTPDCAGADTAILPQQMQERIAELQYEAGMYQSLYESLWVCSGCGTRKSMEQIKGEAPRAISCCPEREMVPAHTRPKCGGAAE